MTPIKTPKKLIEVALPLDAINVACAREKSIRHGHPSTLHLWWARRPLAAARAVIFAQMVNDPGYQQGGGFRYGVNKEKAAIERERLFKIIEDLVLWENTNNDVVLAAARAEIVRSWRETCELNKAHPQAATLFNPDQLPAFHDPFAGGGALPLEAQRLGLESYASDLNPVAVTINKAMIEIPPKFAGRPPVGPLPEAGGKASQDMFAKTWHGAQGLAEDVRRYGAWMRAEALKRIGHLYPTIEVTPELIADNDHSTLGSGQESIENLKNTGLAGLQVGQQLTVIAWLWARTVKSPNPAFNHVDVPLASTFILSSKEGKKTYVQPVVEGDRYTFVVRTGMPPSGVEEGTKAKGRGSNFLCLLSGVPISGDYIKAEGQAGRLGMRLMAVVAEGNRGRVYLDPNLEQEAIAQQADPKWTPSGDVPARLTGGTCVPYGLRKWGDLFTPRQIVVLTAFSDLIPETIALVRANALAAGHRNDGLGLDSDGSGATAYAEAVGVYLAFALDKVADRGSSLGRWDPTPTQSGIINTFSRQALPMTWDFAESNPLGNASGNFVSAADLVAKALLASAPLVPGFGIQADASTQTISAGKLVSTDPPYYDNIGYADLSDFFYVWMRKSLRLIYPNLFATVAVPKAEELVATAHRHGGKTEAEAFFLEGMTHAMHNLAAQAHPAFPVTIYYAFKQADTKGDAGTHSTGWETFLEAVLRAGFALTGTWPMRTELGNRMIGSGTNALASSIVLVCRPRAADAPTISRREFIRELNAALPDALLDMTRGGVNSPVAPVDLSQAIIGPGMAIFSQYAAVLEADGTPMRVRAALQLINRFLAEDDFDHDTQFCLAWFEHLGWATGKFGEALVLAQAKGTSPDGLAAAGVVESGGGNLRLLRWAELPEDWNPAADAKTLGGTPVWEALHHLIRALNMQGETAAGALLAQMPERVEPMRALAYRLYTLCERKGWAEEARAYNELITSWQGIEAASLEAGPVGSQAELDI
jgi:putative DNA methylase